MKNTSMSKLIDVHLSQIRFPSSCVVCTAPGTKKYELRHIAVARRKTYTVKLNVPMCESHFQSATLRGGAERVMDKLGLILGALTGLLVIVLCVLYRQATGEDDALRSLFAGGIFGLGIFLVVWAGISRGVAPLFATTASKEARRAVRFRRYWPRDQFVRLEFHDEQLADIVQNTYRASPKPTHIRARTPGV
jgi:hypothetical protein